MNSVLQLKTYRVPWTVIRMCFSLGFHCELSIQDFLHRHVFIKTAGRLHLIIAFLLPTLPLFLNRYSEPGET